MSRFEEIRAREQSATPGPLEQDTPEEYPQDLTARLKWWATSCDRTNFGCLVPSLLQEAANEISRLTAQVEAFERAYRELIELRDRISPWCIHCEHWNECGNEREYTPSPLCANCRTSHNTATYWQFDEARFAGGERE